MRLNKRETRVLVSKKHTFYNYLGYTILGGIPFGFLAITQDLFKFRNDDVSITAWGIVGIGIIIGVAWKKIKEVVKDYNAFLGSVGQRAKLPIVMGIVSLILMFTYISIGLILGITLSFTASGFIAMIPLNAYDKENEKAKRMTLVLKKEAEEKEVSELEELKQLKQLKRLKKVRA